MKIENFYSPNFDKKKRSTQSIKAIIIHYTVMQSERESIKRLCNPKFKVSSHFVINSSGKIYRLVKEDKVAWHAGKSCWGKFKNLNKNSIGIELVNKGHRFGYTNYTKKQLFSLTKICSILIKKYKIKKQNIVGHSDIAPLRKNDPGEKFPWKKLSRNKIGIWYSCKTRLLKENRKNKNLTNLEKKQFENNLKKIGYCLFNIKKTVFFRKILIAFQRHYRQELINGFLDRECLIIAQNLSKLV